MELINKCENSHATYLSLPAPPRAATNIEPSLSKSPTILPFTPRIIVPTGTGITLWSALFPTRSLFRPFCPLSALMSDETSPKLFTLCVAVKTT